MFKKIRIGKYCVVLVMLFTTVIASTAQELCEELSREIFEETGENCAETSDLVACYGFDSVSATFYQEIANGFSNPSDLVEMLQLQTLSSTEFDPEEEEWGIGYFRISVEGSDEPLIIMAAGDVVVENDIEAAEDAGISPMQAFNFTTGGVSQCQRAPNAVILQGPQDIGVDLIVNSTPIRMSSTIILGTTDANTSDNEPQDDTMWIAVLEGSVITNPETEEAVTIPEGSAATVPLTDQNGDVPDGDNVLNVQRVPVVDALTGEPVIGPNGEPFYRQVPYQGFSEPQEITEDAEGIFNLGNFGFVNNIPLNLINYEVEVEEVTEALEPVVESTPVPVVPASVPSEEPISVVDENVTECGTQNWCNAGEPWGDGRCNDPDPDVSAWYWESGWYQAQLECGAIEEVPETFALAEQAQPTPIPVATAAPTAIPLPTAGCTIIDDLGGAPGTYWIDFEGGNFQPSGTGLSGNIDPGGLCANPGVAGYTGEPVAYALDAATAAQICAANGAPSGGVVNTPGVTDVWFCR